jgi:ArsR family transcriptional regulator
MPTEWIEEVADLFKALSEPTRLRLLLEMRERELAVSELASLSGTSLANVSKHLSHMKRIGLVARRKSGNRVLYALSDGSALDMVDAV